MVLDAGQASLNSAPQQGVMKYVLVAGAAYSWICRTEKHLRCPSRWPYDLFFSLSEGQLQIGYECGVREDLYHSNLRSTL